VPACQRSFGFGRREWDAAEIGKSQQAAQKNDDRKDRVSNG
jgi:hypothetical protein